MIISRWRNESSSYPGKFKCEWCQEKIALEKMKRHSIVKIFNGGLTHTFLRVKIYNTYLEVKQ